MSKNSNSSAAFEKSRESKCKKVSNKDLGVAVATTKKQITKKKIQDPKSKKSQDQKLEE